MDSNDSRRLSSSSHPIPYKSDAYVNKLCFATDDLDNSIQLLSNTFYLGSKI